MSNIFEKVENTVDSAKTESGIGVSLSDMQDLYGKVKQAADNAVAGALDEFGNLDIFDSAADFKPLQGGGAKKSETGKGAQGDRAMQWASKPQVSDEDPTKTIDHGANPSKSQMKYDQSRDEEVMLEDGDTSYVDDLGVQHITKRDGTEVTCHKSGYRVTEKPDGSRIIRNEDGSVYSYDKSSHSQTWEDTEGNKKTEFLVGVPNGDGTYHNEVAITQYTNSDGSTHTEYKNGDTIDENEERFVTKRHDGTVEIEDKKSGKISIQKPEGTEIEINPKDGSKVTRYRDGVIETSDSNGKTTVFNPNDGSLEVRDEKTGESIKFANDSSWIKRVRSGKVTGSGQDPNREEPHL